MHDEVIAARSEVERQRARAEEWERFDAEYDVCLHEADKIVKPARG